MVINNTSYHLYGTLMLKKTGLVLYMLIHLILVTTKMYLKLIVSSLTFYQWENKGTENI